MAAGRHAGVTAANAAISAATTAAGEVASVSKIRKHFPALKRKENGTRVAYFDGPGGTQVPSSVATAMAEYLLNHNANTHWAYPTSVETDTMLAASRQMLEEIEKIAGHERADSISERIAMLLPANSPANSPAETAA